MSDWRARLDAEAQQSRALAQAGYTCKCGRGSTRGRFYESGTEVKYVPEDLFVCSVCREYRCQDHIHNTAASQTVLICYWCAHRDRTSADKVGCFIMLAGLMLGGISLLLTRIGGPISALGILGAMVGLAALVAGLIIGNLR